MDDFSGEAANPYPYDPFPDAAGEAFDFLRSSRKDGEVHIPAFARHTLERLRETGLIHRTDIESPDNIRRIKVDGQQDLWIRFGTRRTTQGYKVIEVLDSPRTDRAILAAMVAWTCDPVDLEQLRPAMAEWPVSHATAGHIGMIEAVEINGDGHEER